MVRWIGGVADRERAEELSFREGIFLIRWSDHLIWSTEFYLTTSPFNSSCMNGPITDRICLFETIRIVNFFINMLNSDQVFLRSFSRDDFFHIYWFSESPRDQRARRWVCDSDEIRSQWQQNSKMTWSEEKTFVTNEDLDSQKDLDESWDERSVNRWLERIFYIMSGISHLD